MTPREKVCRYLDDYRDTVGLDYHDMNRHREGIANDIFAAVREAMLSDDPLEALNSSVELETINVHTGEFRINADEMMVAALTAAGITESEVENDTE